MDNLFNDKTVTFKTKYKTFIKVPFTTWSANEHKYITRYPTNNETNPTNNEAKWLDDGDCIICSNCKKAFGSQYIERKNDTVLVPITCPNCHSNMTDIVKA